MTIRPYNGIAPSIAESAYIDPQACVIGDVHIGAESSVWPMTVIRGDVNRIRIGARSNIQDGSVLHVTHDHAKVPGGHPLLIGDEVTIGHQVTLHGCTIGERCLIGMASIILDGARLEPYVMLGAGSLVAPGKTLEGGYLYVGRPAKRMRALTDEELAGFEYSAGHYVRLQQNHKKIL